MKTPVARPLIVIVLIVSAAVLIVVARRKPPPPLPPGETEMLALARELYAGKIFSERVSRDGGDAILVVELRDKKLRTLQINLSELARKRAEGVSPAALKASMRFE